MTRAREAKTGGWERGDRATEEDEEASRGCALGWWCDGQDGPGPFYTRSTTRGGERKGSVVAARFSAELLASGNYSEKIEGLPGNPLDALALPHCPFGKKQPGLAVLASSELGPRRIWSGG